MLRLLQLCDDDFGGFEGGRYAELITPPRKNADFSKIYWYKKVFNGPRHGIF